MKKLILTIATAFVTTAHATSICPSLGSLARTIMEARQSGGPLSKVMEHTQGNKLHTRMVLQAYEQPRFQSEEVKQRAVEDYGNEWETTCYKATSGEKSV